MSDGNTWFNNQNRATKTEQVHPKPRDSRRHRQRLDEIPNPAKPKCQGLDTTGPLAGRKRKKFGPTTGAMPGLATGRAI